MSLNLAKGCNSKSKVKMVKEVLINKSVKNVLKIKEQYDYEQEVLVNQLKK